MPELPFGYAGFAIAAAIIAVGYLVFAITGFGAALLTVPVLSHYLPLPFVLPLSVMLDVAAALVLRTLGRGTSAAAHSLCDWRELGWMVPAALVGALVGVKLLVELPRAAALAALGTCAIAYGAYSLRSGGALSRISLAWAPVSGFAGGTMGTLFGIGAPPYAIYLTRRIEEKTALRATLTTMVLFSTGIRLAVFVFAGLVLRDRLLAFALLLPFALGGLWIGHRLHLAFSREKVLAAISLLLIAMGASLLFRAASG